jgi:acyl-coenzyme A synthetase/AMP-(fatty) acid ligase
MLYKFFLTNVNKTSELTAVVTEQSEALSYSQVNERVDKFARFLLSKGVKQGHRVGIITSKEDQHYFFLLALNKLNATYFPFDSEIPVNQFEADVKKVDLHIMFTQEELIEKYKVTQTISFDEKTILASENKTPFPEIKYDKKIPVYAIGSSGSSGDKKWIPITEEGLHYWAETEDALIAYEMGHKVLCTCGPGFDARISEYLRTLIKSGQIHFISRTQRKDINFIFEYAIKNQINDMLLISSRLEPAMLRKYHQKLKDLKNVIVTGDACQTWFKEFCEQNNINGHNAYGSTENCLGSSLTLINGVKLFDSNGNPAIPVRFPYGDKIKYHLLDKRLYIESDELMTTGYINDPQKTAANFPTITIDGRQVRVFDTGDIFTLSDDGKYLLFQGRDLSNNETKIAGQKIDFNTTESLIREYQKIDDNLLQLCVVIKKRKEKAKLFCYLSVAENFDKDKFNTYVNSWLSTVERPIFINLPKFPVLEDSDKIARKHLMARNDILPQELFFATEGNEPQKETSIVAEKLIHLWKELLDIESIDIDDDFIDYGGDSLLLASLVGYIQRHICKEFSLEHILMLGKISIRKIDEKITELNGNVTQEIKSDIAIIHPLTPTNLEKGDIFFLPPLLGDGSGLTYQKLADVFKKHHDYNIYGLTDPGIFDDNLLPENLPQAAERYFKAIKKIQPFGPYRLLGYSFGSVLAYHVAMLLSERGDGILELYFVDGFPPHFYHSLPNAAHAVLINELIDSVLTILNGSFYAEKVVKPKIDDLPVLPKLEQVKILFHDLENQVEKKLSRCLIHIAQRHLELILKDRKVQRLAVKPLLFFSDEDKGFLALLNTIPSLHKFQIEHICGFWNYYFHRITIGPLSSGSDHISILKNQYVIQGEITNPVERLFHIKSDPYRAESNIRYLYEIRCGGGYYGLYLLGLDFNYLHFLKEIFSNSQYVSDAFYFPLADRYIESVARKLYAAHYAVALIFHEKHLHSLLSILKQLKFHYIEEQFFASERRKIRPMHLFSSENGEDDEIFNLAVKIDLIADTKAFSLPAEHNVVANFTCRGNVAKVKDTLHLYMREKPSPDDIGIESCFSDDSRLKSSFEKIGEAMYVAHYFFHIHCDKDPLNPLAIFMSELFLQFMEIYINRLTQILMPCILSAQKPKLSFFK